MSTANTSDDSNAQSPVEDTARASESRVPAPISDARPFSPVCLSCGFPRKGLRDAILNCPECGTIWSRATASQPWAASLDRALRLILWSVGVGMFGLGLRQMLPASAYSGSALFAFNISAWLLLPIAACVWLATRELAFALEGRAARVARSATMFSLLLLFVTSTGIDDRVQSLAYYILGARGTLLDSSYFTGPLATCGAAIAAASLLATFAAAGGRLGFGARSRRAGLIAAWLGALACAVTLLGSSLNLVFWNKSWTANERSLSDFVSQLTQTLSVVELATMVLLWLGVWLGALVLRRHIVVVRQSAP